MSNNRAPHTSIFLRAFNHSYNNVVGAGVGADHPHDGGVGAGVGSCGSPQPSGGEFGRSPALLNAALIKGSSNTPSLIGLLPTGSGAPPALIVVPVVALRHMGRAHTLPARIFHTSVDSSGVLMASH